jgi:hypothetical protein
MATTTLLVPETSAAQRIWFSNFNSSSIAASNLLSCGTRIQKHFGNVSRWSSPGKYSSLL